jgi:hypothetical protein
MVRSHGDKCTMKLIHTKMNKYFSKNCLNCAEQGMLFTIRKILLYLCYQRPSRGQIMCFTIFCLLPMVNLIPACRWLVLSLCNNFHLLKNNSKKTLHKNTIIIFESWEQFYFIQFWIHESDDFFIEKIHFPNYFSKILHKRLKFYHVFW